MGNKCILKNYKKLIIFVCLLLQASPFYCHGEDEVSTEYESLCLKVTNKFFTENRGTSGGIYKEKELYLSVMSQWKGDSVEFRIIASRLNDSSFPSRIAVERFNEKNIWEDLEFGELIPLGEDVTLKDQSVVHIPVGIKTSFQNAKPGAYRAVFEDKYIINLTIPPQE